MEIQKSLICVFAVMIGFFLLQGCASTETRLSDRGLSPKDRREYISENGFGLSKEMQQAFVEGRIIEGMSRDMVLHLFGSPDRTSNGDSLWEYVNHRGEDIVGVGFKSDRIIQIYGDPFGRAHHSSTPMEPAVP